MPQSQHSGQLVAQEVFIKDTGTGPLGTLDIWFQNKTTFSLWKTVEQTCWNFCSTVMPNKRLRGRWNCQKSSHLVPFMAIQLVDDICQTDGQMIWHLQASGRKCSAGDAVGLQGVWTIHSYYPNLFQWDHFRSCLSSLTGSLVNFRLCPLECA